MAPQIIRGSSNGDLYGGSGDLGPLHLHLHPQMHAGGLASQADPSLAHLPLDPAAAAAATAGSGALHPGLAFAQDLSHHPQHLYQQPPLMHPQQFLPPFPGACV